MKRFHGLTTSALALAAALGSGCGDEPLAPTSERVVPLAASAEERELMRVSLLFAQGQSSLVLTRSEGSAVAAAFGALTLRVERNDRVAVERGVGDARAAIQRYRDLAGGDNAVNPDLEAMTLTLDQVAALATGSLSSQEPQP
jgi:hypothetical protein